MHSDMDGAGRIELEIRYEQRQLRLRVLDNGRGIDQKVLAEGGIPDSSVWAEFGKAPNLWGQAGCP
jgi:hypothetical protein